MTAGWHGTCSVCDYYTLIRVEGGAPTECAHCGADLDALELVVIKSRPAPDGGAILTLHPHG